VVRHDAKTIKAYQDAVEREWLSNDGPLELFSQGIFVNDEGVIWRLQISLLAAVQDHSAPVADVGIVRIFVQQPQLGKVGIQCLEAL